MCNRSLIIFARLRSMRAFQEVRTYIQARRTIRLMKFQYCSCQLPLNKALVAFRFPVTCHECFSLPFSPHRKHTVPSSPPTHITKHGWFGQAAAGQARKPPPITMYLLPPNTPSRSSTSICNKYTYTPSKQEVVHYLLSSFLCLLLTPLDMPGLDTRSERRPAISGFSQERILRGERSMRTRHGSVVLDHQPNMHPQTVTNICTHTHTYKQTHTRTTPTSSCHPPLLSIPPVHASWHKPDGVLHPQGERNPPKLLPP